MPYMRPRIKRAAKAAFGLIGYSFLLITGGLLLLFSHLAAGHPSLVYDIINYGLMLVLSFMMLFAVPFSKITQERFSYFFLFIMSLAVIACCTTAGFLPVLLILLIGAWAAARGGLQSIMPCILFLTFTVFVLDYAVSPNWAELALGYAAILLITLFLKGLHRLSAPVSLFFNWAAYAFVFCFFWLITFAGLYFAKLDITSLSANDINAILQNSIESAGEFIFTIFSAWDIFVLFVAPIIGVWLFARILKAAFREKEESRPLIILFYIILTALFAYHINNHMADGVLKNISASYNEYKETVADAAKYSALRAANNGFKAEKKEQGETYLLIIDGSAARDNLSAYGYLRDTTPWLKSKTQDGNFIFFNNAYSSSTEAAPALMAALTSNNQYQEADKSAPAVTEALNAAGFNTYWFSNRPKYSFDGNPLTALAQNSKNVKFLDYGAAGKDNMLLPYIKDALLKLDKNANNFIVVNLAGSRAPYAQSLPSNFNNPFKGEAAATNTYDATRLNSDGIIQQIYNMAQKAADDKVNFVYVSDRGATLKTPPATDVQNINFEMLRIPLVLGLSPQFTERYPQKTALLKQNKNKVFTLDLLFDLILGLTNTESDLRQSKFDLSDKRYSITPDNAVTMPIGGEPLKITDDPKLIEQANLDYLNQKYPAKFAAACNSAACLQKAFGAGFEAAQITANAQSGLTKSVEEIPFNRFKKVLLKTDGLTAENIPAVIEGLNALDKTLNLKNKVIIESALQSEEMAAFAKNGWQTSYYYDKQTAPQSGPQIAKIMTEQKAGGVTFPAESYNFIRWQVIELLPPYTAMHVKAQEEKPLNSKDYAAVIEQQPYTKSWRVKTVLQDFDK